MVRQVIFDLLPEALERAGRDKRRGLELGRDFAKHAYDQVSDTMDPEFVSSSEAYWRATDAYIDGDLPRDELLDAVHAIPKIEQQTETWGRVESPALAHALYALCLRYDEPGIQLSKKRLWHLAKDAQLAVAEHAAEAAGDPQRAFAVARWQEARWQLQHIIATEPNLADK